MLEPIPFAGYMEIEEMNNEPVAWMVNGKAYADIFEAEHYSKFTNKPMIPLYTAPQITELRQPMQILDDGRIVPVFKELSDEEIYKVWNTLPYDNQCPFDGRGTYNFARAILKKASEK